MVEEVPLEGCNCINCRLARMELKLTEIEKEIVKILNSEQSDEIAPEIRSK